MNLDGKTAVITGGARGIGLAISKRLAGDGADIAIVDINQRAAIAQAKKITAEFGVAAKAFGLDLTVPERAADMAGSVSEEFGGIDILVNNAGITGYARSVSEYEASEWRRVMSINLDAVFYCTHAVLPGMLAKNSGRIVNISSISGKEGNPNMSAYSTSKAGVIGFTKALGKELATTGVIVNCVTPAVVETELLAELTDEAVAYMVSKIPMGRVGKPEEIAAMVAWLCSDECSFTTGGVFDLSGGRATY